MQYFILNRNSNLIQGFISSSFPPAKHEQYKFILASDKTLDLYFKWVKKNPDSYPDICDLASKSKYLTDEFNPAGRKTFPTFSREDCEPAPPAANAREAAIASWIDLHPKADEHDLHERFNTGVVAGKAYLQKYRIPL